MQENELERSEVDALSLAVQQEETKFIHTLIKKYFDVVFQVVESSAFMKASTPLLSSALTQSLLFLSPLIAALDTLISAIKIFSTTWRSNFASMRTDIKGYFPNLALGARILRMAITQTIYMCSASPFLLSLEPLSMLTDAYLRFRYQKFTEIMKLNFASIYNELLEDFVPLNVLTAAAKEYYIDS